MLITIDTKDIAAAAQMLRSLSSRGASFAMMNAINNLAFGVRQQWPAEAAKLFDRPTPLTQKALQFDRARKDNLSATIKFRDDAFKGTPPAKYLSAQLSGGARAQKRFEKRLVDRGILPAGMMAVPGAAAKLDRYGNLSQGVIGKILSALGAQFDRLQNETPVSRERRDRSAARRGKPPARYFFLRKARGKLPAGVYERTQFRFGSAVKPILVFVRQGNYEGRIKDFNFAQAYIREHAERAVADELASEILRALSRR